MTPEKWRIIKLTFEKATELSTVSRESFLATINDREIALEVRKMLAADHLELPEISLFKEIISTHDEEENRIPAKIGKYRIVREIGRGGMGAVYLGARDDGEFKQTVAVKLIKRGMDSEEILRRFRVERQILAELQHPFIARLYDGGMSDEGLPFYAMEFIEGEPIDRYCADKKLDEKIEIFRQVCSAVSYAHTHLIVHRDLKPSNILVMSEGVPKLLDFGIAKVLNTEAADSQTATQLGMMTPAYASPEQIKNEKVTTTADVYSLGVILYELLTGEKPYRTDGKNVLEVIEIICRSQPPKPSTIINRRLAKETSDKNYLSASETGSLRKSLRGDLDNIILKALHKEPTARYQSVEQFSEDLRRYQVGLPVSARPENLGYRLGKFIQRNRLPVVAGLLVFLSLCAGLTLAIRQTYVARLERQKAENRFNQVRLLANAVVFKYHDAIAELPGATAAREMLVRDALQYLDNLAEESEGDEELQLELAHAYFKLGDVKGKIYSANVGDSQGALQSYRKSVALYENVLRLSPDNVKAKTELIKVYDSLAFLLMRTGGGHETVALIEKALGLHQELPPSEETRRQLTDLLIRYGDTRKGFENTLREHQKAFAVVSELISANPDNTENLKQAMRVNQRIGTDYQRLGDREEKNGQADAAREYFRQSLDYHRNSFDISAKLLALEPESAPALQYYAMSSINLAESLAKNDKIGEAINLLKNAQDIIERQIERDMKNSEAKFVLSVVHETFGIIYSRAGDRAKAAESYRRSLTLDEEIYRRDPQNKEVSMRIEATKKLLKDLLEHPHK